MPIFYLNVGTVSRGDGRSVVAAAAFCSRSKLYDDRLDRVHDFTANADLVHSELLLGLGAPERWRDREVLWNEVEAIEARKDAALAREIEVVIPSVLRQDEGVSLVREFMLDQFVARGMVVDLNVHRAIGADGRVRTYALSLFSMREVSGEGFGKKRSEWKERNVLLGWRKRWAALATQYLLRGRPKGVNRRASGRRVWTSARPAARRGDRQGSRGCGDRMEKWGADCCGARSGAGCTDA
jgi:hypothetical protein